MLKYKGESDSEWNWIDRFNNFGVLVNGKYAYYSSEADKEGWTWISKERINGNKLKSGEKPDAWHTTQFGNIFALYKKCQFERKKYK